MKKKKMHVERAKLLVGHTNTFSLVSLCISSEKIFFKGGVDNFHWKGYICRRCLCHIYDMA